MDNISQQSTHQVRHETSLDAAAAEPVMKTKKRMKPADYRRKEKRDAIENAEKAKQDRDRRKGVIEMFYRIFLLIGFAVFVVVYKRYYSAPEI